MIDKLGKAIVLTEQQVQRYIEDDDDFDAFVSAPIARATQVGQTDPIPRGMQWVAMREGWIHLPLHDSLSGLAALHV